MQPPELMAKDRADEHRDSPELERKDLQPPADRLRVAQERLAEHRVYQYGGPPGLAPQSEQTFVLGLYLADGDWAEEWAGSPNLDPWSA